MKLEEYQNKTHSTAIYPQDTALYYLSMGLLGELGELLTTDNSKESIICEAGGCWWYISELTTFLDYDLQSLWEESDPQMIEDIYTEDLLLICNTIKKIIRDDCNKLSIDKKLKIKNFILKSIVLVRRISSMYDTEAILQANIDKLADRQRRNVISGSGDNR